MDSESKSKRKKKILSVYTLFYGVLILIALLIGHLVVHRQQNVRFFDSKELRTFSTGWTLTCSSGVYDVTLPIHGEYENTDETVYLENTLPEELNTGTVLLIRSSLQELRVLVDGVEIYNYGKTYKAPLGKSNGSIWNIVSIPGDADGKTITLEITSPYKTYREIFNNVFIGTFRGAIGHLFHEYGFSFVLIMLEFVVSILLFLLYLILKASSVPVSKKMLHVSAVGFFSAAWLFTECKLTQVFIGKMAGFSASSFVFLAIVLIPALFYVDELEKQYYHKYICAMVALLEINATVQIIIQFTGLLDFYEMMSVTHVLMGLAILVAIGTAVHRYIVNKSHEMMVLIMVTALMAFSAFAEMFITYFTGYVSGGILEFCVMLTFLMAIGESVNDTAKTISESRKALSENVARTSFLAKVSHEIRTPMNAICAMSDLMEKSNELSKNNQEAVRTIHSSALNLLEMINELIDYSKLSAGKLEISERSYELSTIISEIKDSLGVRAAEKGLDFEIAISPFLPTQFKGDPTRIIQMLSNLLSNAIKYTYTGRVSLKITGSYIPGNYIKLIMTVKDTGVGIKEEDKARLFEPFIGGSDKKGFSMGTGLGLTVTRQLANLMGGTVEVESEYGVGSSFTATIIQMVETEETYRSLFAEVSSKEDMKKVFLAEGDYSFTGYVRAILNEAVIPYEIIRRGMLDAFEYSNNSNAILILSSPDYRKSISEAFFKKNPRVEVVVIQNPTEELSIYGKTDAFKAPLTVCDCVKIFTEDRVPKGDIFFDASNASIMVVDDNVVNLKVMSAALKRFGVKPTLIASGRQAIDAVKNKNYDLIFMDHMMPDLDGVETELAIRDMEAEGIPKVKIVALTANASIGIEKMFKEKGFDGFLSKPVSIEMIANTLRKQLPKEKISENNENN